MHEKEQKNSLTFPLFCCSRISMEEKVALWLVRPGRVRLLGRPGRYESRYILAISLIFEGTSCFVSVRSVISSSAIFAFFSLKNAVAQPVLPARPVRPIRCTYSSISDGRSKLITWRTFGISNPRAATAVATKIGFWAVWREKKFKEVDLESSIV